jgi:hypothetical protein
VLQAPAAPVSNNHTGRVIQLEVVAAGKKVLSIGEDCMVRCWETASAACNRVHWEHSTGLHGVSVVEGGAAALTYSANFKVGSCRGWMGKL